jgi:purine-binding chemotaxis protein CheW
MDGTDDRAELEILVFEVAGQRYGVEASAVVEITRAVAITPLPKAPPIVEGVINARGTVLPVLDIRRRFRLAAKSVEPSDHLVVARAAERTVVLRVDRVHALAKVDPSDVETGKHVVPRSEYVAGIAKLASGLVLVHDLATFLTQAEAIDIDDALAQTAEDRP